jgi:hypothetical protein
MTLFPSKIPPPKGIKTDAEVSNNHFWISKSSTNGFKTLFLNDAYFNHFYFLIYFNFEHLKRVIQELKEYTNPSSMKEWWMELWSVVKRLGTNPIFMLNLFSAVFVVLANVGFYTFMPKYFEFAFRQKASTAAVAGGAANCLASALGLILAGYVIKRWKPSARWLSAWMIATTVMGVIGSLSLILIGCPSLDIHGMTSLDGKSMDAHSLHNRTISCNAGCKCSKQRFSPICSADGATTFFSPCHAGCSSIKDTNSDVGTNSTLNNNLKMYRQCSCVKNSMKKIENLARTQQLWWHSEEESQQISSTSRSFPNEEDVLSNTAVEGYCPSNCQQQFFLLVIAGVILGSMASTGLLPSTLINMRAIKRIDKSASITLSVSALSAFAILPSPIIFGAIYDSSCTIWGEKCGETLNCLVYDTEKLRVSIAMLMASLMALALIGNCGVWYFVKNLKIYDEGDDEKEDTTIK